MGTLTPALSIARVSKRSGATIALFFTYASVVFADMVALIVAGSAAVIIRHFFHGQFRASDYASLSPSILVLLIAFAIGGLYPSFGSSPIEEFRLILRSSTGGFFILTAVTYLLREGMFSSRLVFLIAWLLTVLLVPLFRRAIRGICSRRSWWGVPVVIIGEEHTGRMMLKLLKGHRRLGLRPVAFLHTNADVDHDSRLFAESVVYGHPSMGTSVAQRFPGAYAMLAMPNADSDDVKRVFRDYIREFSTVLIIPELIGLRTLSVTTTDVSGVLALRVRQSLTGWAVPAAKRCIDLILSLCIAVPLLPLFLLLYSLVRLTSKGPAFYQQRRIGRGGEVFYVNKFRSMVMRADRILADALETDPALREEWSRDHKLKNDPRVTWIGKILRKTSLDELPQIWNVICGDMSLVGPRPIVRREVEKYGECYQQYVLVRPGMTGLWQVSGRNNTSYELRTRIDDYYIRNWSLSMDIYILLRTLKTLLLREGAY